MSLGKLLTTGKSLVGLNDSNSRYQLRKGALPKFESSKNPFASKSHNEPASHSEHEPSLPKLTPAEIAAANLKKTQRLPVMQPTEAQTETTTSMAPHGETVEPEGVPSVVGGWLQKLNPMVWLDNHKSVDTKPAVPRPSRMPVQGELSLDNIKVMRNDLSETDVEIVPAKARPASLPSASAGAVAAVMAVPELPSARKAWEFLGEHLMGKH
jgi:hypothetical protein